MSEPPRITMETQPCAVDDRTISIIRNFPEIPPDVTDQLLYKGPEFVPVKVGRLWSLFKSS